jgi:hypothetical protein
MSQIRAKGLKEILLLLFLSFLTAQARRECLRSRQNPTLIIIALIHQQRILSLDFSFSFFSFVVIFGSCSSCYPRVLCIDPQYISSHCDIYRRGE